MALRTRIGEDGGGKVRLFDVVADPFESHDLADAPEHAARVSEMKDVLDARLRP